MSLDYDDPALDRLLFEHARRSRAEFTAPGLDGMLGSALDAGQARRRWAWPVLAAALLLAIPLVTVLLIRHGRTAEQPTQPSPSPTPDTKPVLLGPVPWRDPVWTGDSIWLIAVVPPSQYCKGVPSIQAKVTEDGASSVTIVANVYVDPRAAMPELQKQICDSSGPDSSGEIGISSEVELPGPLNGRSAVDGTAHRAHKVLDASIIPDIPALPPAFHRADYSGDEAQRKVTRAWLVDDRRNVITLSLVPTDSPTGSSWLREGKPSTIGLVNGHPTRLTTGRHSIIWTKGAYVYWLNESSYSGAPYRFSQAQLLDLARSVP
jgi:hypothetical protein